MKYELEDWKKDDAIRIASVFYRHGWWMHQTVAAFIWENYSNEEYAAGWMKLPDDDEVLWAALKRFIWG